MKSKNNPKKILVFFFTLLTFNFLLLTWPQSGHAQLQPVPTSAADPDPTNPLGGVVDIQALEVVFSNIAAIATSLVGLGAFIMIISGGFKWMTSGGDPKKVEAAKQTITYGVIGVALLAIIWLILRFISNFTGVDITIFTIPK